MGVDQGERGGGDEFIVEAKERIIRIYYLRKNWFSIKDKKVFVKNQLYNILVNMCIIHITIEIHLNMII